MTKLPTPELRQPIYNDPFIKWAWYRGETYLAGFKTKEQAEEHGRRNGWM